MVPLQRPKTLMTASSTSEEQHLLSNLSASSISSGRSASPMGPEDRVFSLAQKHGSELLIKPPIKKRQQQTCRKCAILDCAGSQKVSNCKNRCQDCKNIVCQGHNPKRPNKTCQIGWLGID